MGGITQPAKPHVSGNSGRPPTLRHYQSGSLIGIDRELAVHDSTLVVAATGTGKTVTFAELARIEASRGGRTLVLVHRDELVRQTVKKCQAVGLWPDVEKGRERASALAKVVVASVQSMQGARLRRWARNHFTKVVVDEAHHAPAKSYQNVLDHFDAKVVGFTATPARADGKALGDVFATVAFTYDIRAAIAEQFLVPIVARRIVVDAVDLRELDMRAGDFAQDQLAEVMEDERALRGVAVPLLEQARDRSTIAFCVNVAHAEKLADVLNAYRPGCAFAVSGETSDDERDRILTNHAAGKFQFLVNCDLLVEGYDSPAVSCVAMVRPTKSWARFVQCAGRGLRLLGDTMVESVANGKRNCLLLDFTGTAGKHALIGPADCLTSAGKLDDDVREEIERMLANAQLDLEPVIEKAEAECVRRREALRCAAIVDYHSQHIDPFIGVEGRKSTVVQGDWSEYSPTEKQIAYLEKAGVTISKLPRGFSMADAQRLITQMEERTAAGLCSYKMAKKLSSLGVKNTKTLTRHRADQLRNMCLRFGWFPSTLRNEPEVTGITLKEGVA